MKNIFNMKKPESDTKLDIRDAPEQAERHTFSDFTETKYIKKKSKCLPGRVTEERVETFNCPRCGKTPEEEQDHGNAYKCGKCNLNRITFGNGLFIWD